MFADDSCCGVAADGVTKSPKRSVLVLVVALVSLLEGSAERSSKSIVGVGADTGACETILPDCGLRREGAVASTEEADFLTRRASMRCRAASDGGPTCCC